MTTQSPSTQYRRGNVAGTEVFYREAGRADAPAILLLHGFPTSSHMYRNLIPRLADRWRVIAPDLPGFGFSAAPDRHSFDRLAEVIEGLTEQLGLTRFAVMVFDYGAPVGFRLALRHPERIAAIISQNGNAYLEGLSAGFNPIQAYWQDPSAANREALRGFLAAGTTQWQYTHGAHDPAAVAPEAYTLDQHFLDRPGNAEFQLDLFLDYAANVALYPAIQRYLRDNQPPLLATWGRNDPFFLPPGAEAFRRDVPGAEIHFVDAGHFALETKGEEIAALVRDFLARVHAS
jgi:pimeloyl-ACP methyl ester carboxylesterase